MEKGAIQKTATYVTKSAQETQAIAQTLVTALHGHKIICLYGDLGAGKTTFVQGLAKGLGITKRIISPTFIIVRTYNLKSQIPASSAGGSNRKSPSQIIKRFHHIDLYRIETVDSLKGLGIEEIINDPSNIVAIEWAEKLGMLLPKKRIDVTCELQEEQQRKIIIAYYG